MTFCDMTTGIGCSMGHGEQWADRRECLNSYVDWDVVGEAL